MIVTLTLDDGTQIFQGSEEPRNASRFAMWAYKQHCRQNGGTLPWYALPMRTDDDGWIIPLAVPGGLEQSHKRVVNVRLTIVR